MSSLLERLSAARRITLEKSASGTQWFPVLDTKLRVLDQIDHINLVLWVIAHALYLATTYNCKAWYPEHGMVQHLVIKVVKGPSQFLLSVFGGFRFVDAWSVVGGVPSECDVQGLQESVHSSEQTLRLARRCSSAWLTIIHNYAIC